MAKSERSIAWHSRVIRWAGELLVIVVGVLIALAADEWRQGRRSAEVRAEYLLALAEDMARDSVRLDQHQSDLTTAQSWTLAVLDLLDEGTLPADMSDFPGLVRGLRAIRPLFIERATYDQMIATGSLTVPDSPELSRAVTDYDLTVDRLERLLSRLSSPLSDLDEALLTQGYRLSMPQERRPSSPEYFDYLSRQPKSREVLGRVYQSISGRSALVNLTRFHANERYGRVRAAVRDDT